MAKGKGKGKRRGALHLLKTLQVLEAPDGDLGDGGGLILRVRKGGASWVFRYTSPSGKRREMGLGIARRGSLAQAGASLTAARDAAHKARELLRQGVDPLDAKAEKRRADAAAEQAKVAERQRERWTLARCARDYHARVVEPKRKTKHAAQWIASLENHIPAALWHRPIDQITKTELLDALLAIRPHERARRHSGDSLPETMRRIRQRLEVVFDDAIFRERCALNPAASAKRKLLEEGPENRKGQFAALPYKEAPALVQRLRELPYTAARCLELAILCASRTGEVIGAEWSEFDLDAGTWTVPAERMKAKEEHVVYLSARAIEIVKAQAGFDARWVFPSPTPKPDGTSRPLSNMAMLAVLDRLGVRDRTTVHGLCRVSFSTWANNTRAASPDAIEVALAHKEEDRVRAAYNRAEFAAERRALLAAWADYLARPAAPVVALVADRAA